MMSLPHYFYPSCKDTDDISKIIVMRGTEKYAFKKMITAAFQLKITLYTDDAVAVDSLKVLNKTKRGKFEDF